MFKPIKIYRFPDNGDFKYEWVAIGEDKHCDSWRFGSTLEIEDIRDHLLGYYEENDEAKDEDWYKFTQRCENGEHEDFCVWRADGKPLEPPEPFDFTQDYSLD